MRAFIQLFFGRVEVVGKKSIPIGKPIIFSCNHQNAFMDALVIGAIAPIRITSMTRSDVFDTPLRWFMDALQMLPIYRMRDGIDQLAKNEVIFKKIQSLLKLDKAILVFSEGNHGNDYFLRPLTKGSSRMALEALDEMPDKDIQIVPVGINYFHHQRPGNKLCVVFGEAIAAQDHYPAYQAHKVVGANQLKSAISEGMKKCLLIPEETEDYLVKRDFINASNERLGFKALRTAISHDDEKLASKKTRPFLLYIGKILGLFNFLPLLVLQVILKPIRDIVFYGSLKYAAGLIAFPIWYIALFIGFSIAINPQTAALTTLGSFAMLFLRLKILRWANPQH
jgi:1-acyl-sn-glycerol-3-phosphate acyltransferase